MAKKDWRQTGVEGKYLEVGKKPLQAFLYDFNIEGDQLKPVHRRWLETMIVAPAIALGSQTPGKWHIWVFGNTSTTGSDLYNLDLATRRATEVKKYLDRRLGTLPHTISTQAVGEQRMRDAGWGDDVEKELFRSVYIVIVFSVKPPPPPPPPPPPTPPAPPRKFFITLLEARIRQSVLELGYHFVGTFEIRDSDGNVANYKLETGLELSGRTDEVDKESPGSITDIRRFDIRLPGIPQEFKRRKKGEDVRDFEGFATIDRLRVHTKRAFFGRMDFQFAAKNRVVPRGIPIKNHVTGPAANWEATLLIAEEIEFVQSSTLMLAGTFNLT